MAEPTEQQRAAAEAIARKLGVQTTLFGIPTGNAEVFARALASGLTVPEVEARFREGKALNNTDGAGLSALRTVTRDRDRLAAENVRRNAEAYRQRVQDAAAGYAPPIEPQAVPSSGPSTGGFVQPGTGPVGPIGVTPPADLKGMDALRALADANSGAVLGLTGDGTALVRYGADDYGYTFSANGTPILTSINGKALGAGGSSGGGGGGSVNGSYYIPNDIDYRKIAVDEANADTDAKYKAGLISKYERDSIIEARNATVSERNAATSEGNLALERDKFGFLSGPQFQENTRQFNANLEEQARQADQAASVTMRGQNFQLAPALGNLALDQNRFRAEVFRNPADFLSRAFMQRGGQSPFTQMTMADILNNLSADNDRINGFLKQAAVPENYFRPAPTPTAQPAAPVAAVSSSPITYRPQQADATGSFGPTYTPENITREDANASMRAAGVPDWVKGFAQGGMTHAPMFMVGDHPSGTPTGNEEVIVNPTNAPIKVIPNPNNMPRMPRYAWGTDPLAPYRAGGWNPSDPNLPDFNTGDPQLDKDLKYDQSRGGNSWITHDYKPGQLITKGGGGFGTSGFGSTPQIPGGGITTSMEDIQNTERMARPPAVDALVKGFAPQALRFDFPLPSPQALASLTPAEREAWGTTLAVQYNTTPEDVMYAMNRAYGSTGGGFARRVF